MVAALLACDWGTTNLRAWTLAADGTVLDAQVFELGVSRLGPGEAVHRFRNQVRPALGAQDLPAVLCGMIGSDRGWTPVPYVPCPADMSALARGMIAADAQSWIAPGVVGTGLTGAPDVMRGEETQVLGWLASAGGRDSGRRLICHPGTHAKWVLVEHGAIVRFVSAMTGELFDLLRRHGLLANPSAAEDEAAFEAGLAAAGDGGALAARLFSARSRVVAGGAAPETTPSYLSGLLIGAEIAALRPGFETAEGPTVLLGDPTLCARYARAFASLGLEAEVHDGEAAALSGLRELARRKELA